MSRQLPSRPNLEHLKKQSKALLLELRQQNPSTQLAQAQHAIAREYGFPSWPRLKAHVESAHHPLVGRWEANLSKSKRHSANRFRSATIEFTVSGNTVEISDTVIDESGREEHRVNTIQVDGREHPSGSGNGYSLTASWKGSHLLETMARKNGEPAGMGSYEVSPDEKTLTITSDQMEIVLDRVAEPDLGA
jgi:hypothetical protein